MRPRRMMNRRTARVAVSVVWLHRRVQQYNTLFFYFYVCLNQRKEGMKRINFSVDGYIEDIHEEMEKER
jgi:hypothetical protein